MNWTFIIYKGLDRFMESFTSGWVINFHNLDWMKSDSFLRPI